MKSFSNGTIRIVAAACLTTAASVSGQTPGPDAAQAVASQIPGRDLRVDPPRVASLAVVPAPGGAVLRVRFAEGGLPPSLLFLDGGAVRTLRDDGEGEDAGRDGVYSARVGAGVSGAAASAAAVPLDPDKTLLVRDPAVLDHPARTSDPCLSTDPADATKKWTFGYLLTQAANQPLTGRTGSDLALSLLRQWEQAASVNGDPIAARPDIRRLVTDKWLRASGNNGRLAMHKAPFRLLAIVNRVDLRHNLFFGEGLAGELRFVWGVLDLENRAADGSCRELSGFTMIMEYAVDRANAAEVKAWGRRWAALNDLPLDSRAFRSRLQEITEGVVRAGAGQAQSRPNGSALIRIRTNEIDLASPWELREFNLATANQPLPGLFFPVTVKQTPAQRHNRTALLARFVNDNQAKILAGTHDVPLRIGTTNFRGGASPNNIEVWSAPGIRSNEARHLVSVNTCNGCHGAETNTSFLHVAPRPRGTAASLSGFMTGQDVADPVDVRVTRHMDDLARRAADLQALVGGSSLSQLSFRPLARAH